MLSQRFSRCRQRLSTPLRRSMITARCKNQVQYHPLDSRQNGKMKILLTLKAKQKLTNQLRQRTILRNLRSGVSLRSTRYFRRIKEIESFAIIVSQRPSTRALTFCPRIYSSSLLRWQTHTSFSVSWSSLYLESDHQMELSSVPCPSVLLLEFRWSRTPSKMLSAGSRIKWKTRWRFRLPNVGPRLFRLCEACNCKLDALWKSARIRPSLPIWSYSRVLYQKVSATSRLRT